MHTKFRISRNANRRPGTLHLQTDSQQQQCFNASLLSAKDTHIPGCWRAAHVHKSPAAGFEPNGKHGRGVLVCTKERQRSVNCFLYRAHVHLHTKDGTSIQRLKSPKTKRQRAIASPASRYASDMVWNKWYEDTTELHGCSRGCTD